MSAEDVEKEASDEQVAVNEMSDAAPSGTSQEVEEVQIPRWYTLKCQVNREDSAKRELLRNVALAGLAEKVPEVVVPAEVVVEWRNGKKYERKRKLFPGYLLVQMILDPTTWSAVRGTRGVGDFAGAVDKEGWPLPMTDADVARITKKSEEPKQRMEIPYVVGDEIRITDGNFKDYEGEVVAINQEIGAVTVKTLFLGSETQMELEYWQVEKLEAGNNDSQRV